MKSTGVDVNDITTSDKNLNSAKKLTTVIDNSGISAVTKKTDSNGKVSFTDLAQGMYLVEEKDSASYGMFSPFLVAIPYMEDGQNWIYDVETYTKGVSNQQGSLEVTKALVYMDPKQGRFIICRRRNLMKRMERLFQEQDIMLDCSAMPKERFLMERII